MQSMDRRPGKRGHHVIAYPLDEIVIDEVLRADDVSEFLLMDDPAQPLEKWWWHLGAIRRREYPVELLPEHLRAVYLEGER